MTRRIGIVVHRHRPEVIDFAKTAVAWCESHDATVVLPVDDATLLGLPELAVGSDVFATDLALILSIGGDGTMLRAVQFAALEEVPIVGVNAGQLGYLTQFDPSELTDALDAWDRNELIEERRMLLEVTVRGNREHPTSFALNETVLERADSGHSVALDASIGGVRFTSYLADGVIVATPTGSTAYSLSAGGPIVEPDFEALVVTPVAPHMVFDRSLILKPSTVVELTVSGYRNGKVTVDGRLVTELEPGETLVCRASDRRVRFLTRSERNFHSILKEKFNLEDR